MYNLCSQHLQSFNSVQQKLFVLQPLKDMFQMPALTLQALVYTVFVCTYACLRPISSRMAGPIWLIPFFVSSVLVTGWFQAKKISQIGPPILEKYFILPFRKFFFLKGRIKYQRKQAANIHRYIHCTYIFISAPVFKTI